MPSFTRFYAGLSSKPQFGHGTGHTSAPLAEAPSSSEKDRCRRDEPKALVLEAGGIPGGAMGMGLGYLGVMMA